MRPSSLGVDADFVPKFNLFTRNNLIVIFVGMSLAIDYSVILVTLPNYWAAVAPQKSDLLGLVIGIYDLSQLLFVPVFGWLSTFMRLKTCFLVALGINILGNVIYCSGIVVGGYRGQTDEGDAIFGTWQLLLVGRFVAGIGSSANALSVVYFARTTSIADRQLASAAQQVPLSIARAAGPALGIFLVASMESHLSVDNKTEQLFNFLTTPGWMVSGFCVLGFFVTLCLFEEPPAQLQSSDLSSIRFDSQKGAGLLHLVGTLLPIHFLITFVRMALLGSYTYLAVGQYHFPGSTENLWVPWMGVLVGSAVGSILMKRLIARGMTDVDLATKSMFPLAIGLVMLCNFEGKNKKNNETMYFIASGLAQTTNIMVGASFESIYTKCISVNAEAAQGKDGFFQSLFTAFGALGRFLGPFVTLYILTLNFTSDIDSYLSQCRSAPPSDATSRADWVEECMVDYSKAFSGTGADYLQTLPLSVPCNPANPASPTNNCTYCPTQTDPYQMCQSLEQFCLPFHFPTYFFNDGCGLSNVNVYFPIMASVIVTLILVLKFKIFPQLSQRPKPVEGIDDIQYMRM